MCEVLQPVSELKRKLSGIQYYDPENKLLLYHRFVLSNLLLHCPIADLGKIWVAENMDNLVAECICLWL